MRSACDPQRRPGLAVGDLGLAERLGVRDLFVIGALALAACTARPMVNPGEPCELNTECVTPLVCRLGFCRVECRESRDCGPSAACVRDVNGLGACTLLEEATCTRPSQCVEPLVCRFGQCTNACSEDIDCPPGARCLDDGSGELACIDMAETECALNSDCIDPLLICAVDHRCREACRTDRDCRDGLVCRDDLYEHPVCATATALPDGGLDAGTMDAAMLDAGAGDAGAGDAGLVAPPGPPRLAAGTDHTCGSRAADQTACWGSNAVGQIGDGTMVSPRSSATMLATTGVTVVGAGSFHSCVASGTQLRCWGGNAYGQAGPGPDPTLSPTAVPGLPAPITDVASGAGHTCAIASGRLFCWGDNAQGQLGTGDNTPQPTPVEITSLPAPPVQVSTFSNTTCVRLATGAAYCFGSGSSGQVGDGGGVNRNAPSPVSGLTDAIQIGAGTTFACALRATGEVSCWGNDFFGQLGNGAGTMNGTTPGGPLTLPIPVREIAVGSAHACARADDGVYCWGQNTQSQCGIDVTSATQLDVPTLVPGGGIVDSIAAGSAHTCTRTGTSFACFGSNSAGQLGVGSLTPTRSAAPLMVVWP
ncbi:MAG: RCC1 domain-containing protein [Sandaracinaceae bacterium]